MAGLVQALRDRRDALNISHETIDAISGLQSGYCSKLLAPNPIKGLGPMSFEAIMGALGVGLMLVEDGEAAARVRTRWQPRKRPPTAPKPSRASTGSNIEKLAELLAQMTRKEKELMGASKGGKRRAKIMGKRARRRIAEHAARARWVKAREASRRKDGNGKQRKLLRDSENT